MMSSQQRNDPYKTNPFPTSMHSNRSSNSQGQSQADNYYHGLQYGAFGSGQDMYNAMTLPSTMGQQQQDYLPLPAHMSNPGNQPSVSNSNGMSRGHPASHTISHTVTSPHDPASPPTGSDLNLQSLSSPGPSTSRLSMSPEGQSGPGSSQSQVSTNMSPGEMVKQESSDSGSVKSGEDDSGIPPKKRSHSSSEGNREDGYWEKRKKNNESAKRSREARRMKEEQIALRVVYLEQENLQLRTEVSLLKSEIEKLRCMLYNS